MTNAALQSASATGEHYSAKNSRIGALALDRQGLPDQATIDLLYAERDFQRACQCYLWALPIVSYAQWQNQHETVFGAQDGDIVQYVSVRDKLGLITANATTPYVIGFANTQRTGPLIIDFPAGETAGGVGDFWERSMSDCGLTGPDKGKGGRYVILGPGQEAPSEAGADYEVRSDTFNVFHAFRILTTDPARRLAASGRADRDGGAPLRERPADRRALTVPLSAFSEDPHAPFRSPRPARLRRRPARQHVRRRGRGDGRGSTGRRLG